MKIIVAAAMTAIAALSSAQLYTQAPHTPGASGANGLSSFQGNLGDPSVVYDREVADDFVVTGAGWSINRIASSWVQNVAGDTNPITDFDIRFFNGAGGVVGSLVSTATVTNISRTTGPGTYFSRPEQILDVTINPVTLAAGTYFVQIQPLVNHNWFWLTSTPTTPVQGSAAQIQRGSAAAGGTDATWPATWQATGPANPIFTTPYDTNFTIYGSVVPEPASMAVLGLGVAALLRRRCSKK